MKQTLFAHVVDGVEDNNNVNDGKWNDWEDASHAISTYADSFSKQIPCYNEMKLTVELLDKMIESGDDKTIEACKIKFNEEIWDVNHSEMI